VGWRPQVELEEGLRRTIDWYRAHPEARAPVTQRGQQNTSTRIPSGSKAKNA
jgi:dTDP-D-glucose 4,6-dehydratase